MHLNSILTLKNIFKTKSSHQGSVLRKKIAFHATKISSKLIMKFWCALWKLLDLDKWQWEMELFRAFWEIYHVAEVVLKMFKSQTPRQMWPDGAIGHRSHLNLFVRISMDILQNISVDFDWYNWWQQLICWYLAFLTQNSCCLCS